MEIVAKDPHEFLAKCLDAHREGDRLRREGSWQLADEYRDAAERGYNQLLNRVPVHASALRLLGMMYQQRGFNGLCINLCIQALKNFEQDRLTAEEAKDGSREERLRLLNGWMAETYATKGTALRAEGYRDLAEADYAEAMRLAPQHAEVMAAAAGLHINDGTPQKCIELLSRAAKLKPEVLEEESWNLSLAHLELGHWGVGFDLYHKGIRGKERLNKNYWSRGQTPEWDGTPGKTIVVYGEQGVGDEIMFASCLGELQRDCKHVIFDCHPRLASLFERSFPGVEIQPTRKAVPEWAFGREDIEARIAIGSLPKFYRRKGEYFPRHEGYLHPDETRVQHYRERLAELGPPPYIGLAWQGGSKKTRFDLRSIQPRKLAPILAQPGRFISMNYVPEAADEAVKMGLPHWPEAIEDLDEMAALICALDLTVTVNQSLVHQAGAMGRPCWTLTPSRPAWRYGLSGSRMIWYPSVTQFRQRMNEPWAGAIQRLSESLAIFVRKHNADCHRGARPEPAGLAAGAAH